MSRGMSLRKIRRDRRAIISDVTLVGRHVADNRATGPTHSGDNKEASVRRRIGRLYRYTVLALFIVVFRSVYQSAGFAFGVSTGLKPEAKFSNMLASENIQILNSSIAVEPFLAFGIGNLIQFSERVTAVCDSVERNIFIGANRIIAAQRIGGQRKIERIWYGVIEYFGDALNSEIARRSLAGVDCLKIVDEFIALLDLGRHPITHDADISSELAATSPNHHNECAELQCADKSKEASKTHSEIVIPRFILAVLLCFGGLLLALYGPDNERRLFGASVVGGLLLIGLGLGLWCAILLPVTWEWPV